MHPIHRVFPGTLLLLTMVLGPETVAEDKVSGSNSQQSSPNWRWQQQADQSLALVGPRGTVWRLNYAKDQVKVFFDPLGTVQGHSLTWNGPSDHRWHHGLWFSWKMINGVNYWEFDPTGKPRGTTELGDVQVTCPAKSGEVRDRATVVLHFIYHPAGAHPAVMKEKVTLTIELPRPDGSYRIDWHQRSTALVDVELNRTPPPGRPGGVAHGGYGGLSYRGARQLTEVTMTDSQGRTNMAVHRQTARWLDASGMLDGQAAGVTLLDHPSNPRHPTPWFIVRTPKPGHPFWYTNPALLCWEPLALSKGQTLELRYQILVHEGLCDRDWLDSQWKTFAQPN
jgi:hypothetical protein